MINDDPQEICRNIAHNLVTLRKRYGLSRCAMAKLLGISVYSLRVLEQGERLPNVGIEFLFRLAGHFRIRVADFMSARL